MIVDTRPGSQAIFVQLKKSAFNNPDAVARLVAEYYTRELQSVEILLARGARTILWGGR